ncbi:hypothetical protein [Aquimarina litoralis]|uniref:hypothetical protein n=1 Tax=Aquimarina litoralis TaxID=584605 RepID=UPI001C56325F|nr:hypothetical protein [Aquimarina litoralis]MBW1295746.1 hypothetical protein [Aquimarina litoralis]
MKTKLLYVASFMLVLFTACSVEENNELSEQEKDLKIKSLVKTFVEDVRPTSNYKKFIEDVKFKSKNSSGLSQEELDQLEQDFLSQQSPEFVELYYFVDSLNLKEDELRAMVVLYFDSIKQIDINKSDEDTEDCEASAEGNNTDLLWNFLAKIVCEVIGN